ncbi:Maltose/maltodextrin ABC transporter permease protein MalG [Brevinematales bacterium NS]|nr:carbohydrate ABC transporter permease [Brevinematales bacterium]QJR22792.1 Maltose/maltodextrin ABC transporter permease protein MalG [Brevinematales bacterium NS]
MATAKGKKEKKLIDRSFFFDRKDSTATLIYVYISLIIMSIISAYPIYYIFLSSITPGDKIMPDPFSLWPENATIQNYIEAFRTKPILLWMFNSLIVSLISTLVAVICALLAGYGLSRYRFPMRWPLMILLLVTQMFPAPMILLPLYILMGKLGLMNHLMALTVPYVATSIPFTTWLVKGFFDTIPRSLEESAYIDGAGVLTTFFRVVMPLVQPAIAVSAIFTFLGFWSEYIVARVVIMSEKFYTLPLGLMLFRGEHNTKWGQYSAVALVTTIPVLIIFTMLSKQIVGNLTLGSLKD